MSRGRFRIFWKNFGNHQSAVMGVEEFESLRTGGEVVFLFTIDTSVSGGFVNGVDFRFVMLHFSFSFSFSI